MVANLQAGPIVIIVGTRPEIIKMAPVYHALKSAGFPVILCSTAQHMHLLDDMFALFQMQPDFNLKLGKAHQAISYLHSSILIKLEEIYQKVNPRLVLVQGDTTTALAAANAAFYQGIAVGHVEAGLRTGDVSQPFPEEFNRRGIALFAEYHFAPTTLAAAHLLREGVALKNIYCVGNTVVDALYYVQERIKNNDCLISSPIKKYVENSKQQQNKLVLFTMHRRESFDGGIVRVLQTFNEYVKQHPNLRVLFPVHPNPHVQQAVQETGISDNESIFCCQPLSYQDTVLVLSNADLIVTDSGGLQEEAVSLGKSVIVTRNLTERAEGVWEGLATLVGTNPLQLRNALDNWLLKTPQPEMPKAVYGDGQAARRIAQIIKNQYDNIRYIDINNKKGIEVSHDSIEKSQNSVSMVGLGYIGLPTAVLLAQTGFNVHGYDIDSAKIEAINNGNPLMDEPDVAQVLSAVIQNGNFKASNALQETDYYIIAVPTPFKGGKRADLSHVWDAMHAVVQRLKKGAVIIVESTVPVGTTEQIAEFVEQQTGLKVGSHVYVAYCPERVLPSNIIKELQNNDRVLGGITQQCAYQAQRLYASFVVGNLYITNATTAEMVKLVENSSRDVELAFAHQVASMSYEVGLNPYEVIALANKHPRVNILNPTCGVGGHCIAIDPWFLIERFPTSSFLLQAARRINDAKPHEVIERIQASVQAWRTTHQRACTVALLGLTYKANVRDFRESPALYIAQQIMQDQHNKILLVDPYALNQEVQSLQHALVSFEQAVQQADILVCLVAHNQFKNVAHIIRKEQLLIDGCGIVSVKQVQQDNVLQFWPASTIPGTELWQSVAMMHIKEVPQTAGDES